MRLLPSVVSASLPLSPHLSLPTVRVHHIVSLAAPGAAPAWRDGIPNALTTARVVAVPVLAAAFYGARRARPLLAAYIFCACALTDWLDGYLARRWNVPSELGAFLDPVADKLLVCTCLTLLAGELGALVALPTAVVVCREVAVSALREWMGARGASAAVAVGPWGKIKTASQMVALQLLLIAAPLAEVASSAVVMVRAQVILRVGIALLYVASFLTCTSAWGYFAAAAPLLLGGDDDEAAAG